MRKQVLALTAEQRREKRIYNEGVKAGRNQANTLDMIVIMVCVLFVGFVEAM